MPSALGDPSAVSNTSWARMCHGGLPVNRSKPKGVMCVMRHSPNSPPPSAPSARSVNKTTLRKETSPSPSSRCQVKKTYPSTHTINPDDDEPKECKIVCADECIDGGAVKRHVVDSSYPNLWLRMKKRASAGKWNKVGGSMVVVRIEPACRRPTTLFLTPRMLAPAPSRTFITPLRAA